VAGLRVRAILGALIAVAAVVVPVAPPAALASPSGLAAPYDLAAPAALADPVQDQKRALDAEIAALKDDLEGASADLLGAVDTLKGLQGQLATAQAALTAAKTAREAAMRHDQELAAQLAFAQAELDKGEHDLDAEQVSAATSKVALGQLARDTYTDNGLTGLSVVLQATTPEQFTERLAVAGIALRAEGDTIDRLAVLDADLRARNAKLDAVRAQITELKRQSAVVVSQRLAAEQAAVTAEAKVAGLTTDENKQVATIQGKIAGEKDQLDGLQVEQAKLEAILAARAKAAADAARRAHPTGGWTPPASGGFLSYAAPGSITSGFGMRYHPILHIYRMHTGVDWGVPCGTPVHAAANGEIISAGWAGGYGNRIVIDHGEVRGGDLASTYNHLSRILVSGGSVRRGQVIAYSGTTGLSTGCHLHFETLLNGQYVNPMNYL
jgi:murein DD-endopeptidase MepM/ murein hydrolase activator NlpD